jgi:hypothetical protein
MEIGRKEFETKELENQRLMKQHQDAMRAARSELSKEPKTVEAVIDMQAEARKTRIQA